MDPNNPPSRPTASVIEAETVTAVAVIPTQTTALAKRDPRALMAERLGLEVSQLKPTEMAALMLGDMGQLSPQVRDAFLVYRCQQLGLDPLTRPFDLIATDGKVRLYANKSCAEQLRVIKHVSVVDQRVEVTPDLVIVHIKLSIPDSACPGGYRTESNVGSEFIGTIKGDGLAKAIMKAQTKALRRGTLAITGSGLSDTEDVGPRARTVMPDAVITQVAMPGEGA